MRAKLAEIALTQVGVREEGGNNKGPQIVKYQEATWLKPGAWPWCAAFVCWCLRECLLIPEICRRLKLESPTKWRPRTAGAFDFLNWARSQKLEILPETAEIFPGDIIVFDFSHIGIAVEHALARSTYFVDVEGNTNGKGERDSESGDGVWKKTRARSLIRNIIRLPA